jgi:CBS domain containing-hemolysin-like protein
MSPILYFLTITMLHVVFGELVPKNMAIQNAEKMALRIARPLHYFYRGSRYLIHAFTVLANSALKVIGYNHGEEAPLTESELKLVMKESREEGVISESEAQIINRAFEFSDKRARDLLVSRDKVDYISLSRTIEENLAVMKRSMHTRFPLTADGFNHVIGVVHIKDAWPLLLESPTNDAFRYCMRPALLVDPGIRQDRLFRLCQIRRAHMVIVQDPRSRENLGVVTTEDILEELVGEIRDEHGH